MQSLSITHNVIMVETCPITQLKHKRMKEVETNGSLYSSTFSTLPMQMVRPKAKDKKYVNVNLLTITICNYRKTTHCTFQVPSGKPHTFSVVREKHTTNITHLRL